MHLSCGEFANESERSAFHAVDVALREVDGEGDVYVLTNLTHANPPRQADEIDLIVIGPAGAVVVEVKHWNFASLRRHPDADAAVALIIEKSRRLAGRLRGADSKVDFVPPALLLTRESGTLKRQARQQRHALGVDLYTLKDVGTMVAWVATKGPLRPDRLAAILAPRQAAGAGPTLRRLDRFGDLRLVSPADDRFARVHTGRDPATGDRVVIHSYDLSAASTQEPSDLVERRAKREFEVVRRYQKSPYLPSIMDSWQALPGQSGEMFFFSLADSAAVPISSQKNDLSWTFEERRNFAVRALQALAELASEDPPLVHRAIDPESLRVRAGNLPLFAGWRWARLPEALTVASDNQSDAVHLWSAPEVVAQGLAGAIPRSDVYSLCAVLLELFDEKRGADVRAALSLGLESDPTRRPDASEIADALTAEIAIESAPELEGSQLPVPAALWDEGHIFEWRGYRFRVVSVLGRGAAGRTFKLERLDGQTDDPIGTFVGKAVLNPDMGPASLKAYTRLIPHTKHEALSDVVECDTEWTRDSLMALLRWAKGAPLDSWRGMIELLADELGETGPEALVLRWFETLSCALDVLHVQGWTHGDVSGGNILVDEDRAVLIDYDLAGPSGTVTYSPGTALYASPERRAGEAALPRDDVYALACSLFHAITDRPPTREASVPGLPWTDGERVAMPRLVELLDAAAALDPADRFETAGAAVRRLRANEAARWSGSFERPAYPILEPQQLHPNTVSRVKDILCAYPGSRFGNAETRGLDTAFAADTYVETGLDALLPAAIRAGEVSLVILCGNAGDGKTAFLQHLTELLGAEPPPSSRRVWDGIVDGRPVKINLDGAASWNGRSADELLDELFKPFLHGPPKDARVHLVAVNDGRLLEWIDHAEAVAAGSLPLTELLADALGREGYGLPSYIRLIELNTRSLVGGVRLEDDRVSTEFVDQLIDRLVGGKQAPEIWQACRTCTAQTRCPMKRSAEMMGASLDPLVLANGRLMRSRLTEALQAVHQRNEVHVTARELKAALSYILFGLYDCTDLHENPNLLLHDPADHAFDPESPARQGELLRELARLDPALEAHARIDRYLAGRGPPDAAHGAPRFRDAVGAPLPLRTARRRAYLTWSDAQIAAVSGEVHALALKDGRRSSEFRDFPLLDPGRRDDVKRRLCLGLSKLEALPEAAFRRAGVVPVRIISRTSTETAFWVSKPLDHFTLDAERFNAPEGLETLHRFLTLSYCPENSSVERLTVPLELFALLMDLADGVQILDAFSDDVFANLGVFTQRLAQEDERSLQAWNPADEATVYSLRAELRGASQQILLRPDAT